MILDDEKSDDNDPFDSQEMFSMDVENHENIQNHNQNQIVNENESENENENQNENQNHSTTHLEKTMAPQKQPIPESPIGPSFSKSPKKSWFARIFGKNKEKKSNKKPKEKKRTISEEVNKDQKKVKNSKKMAKMNSEPKQINTKTNVPKMLSDFYQKSQLSSNVSNTYKIIKKTSKLSKVEIAANLQKTLNLVGFEWKYPNLFKFKVKLTNLKIIIRIIEPDSTVSKTSDYDEDIDEDLNTVLFILKRGDTQQFSSKLAKVFQFLQL
ncbi:hypothetical protein M0811_00131 [Anaeramoeba ignava]|uniref:Uncharacterized protein n=1 Tax=Anaeramoeba ignava TaxID=1746090 RepID=A0A9Q0RFJ8_ANAIG|nr:hypothetical protein M0811_00131 [Anaeramoeba ignava]